MLKLFKRDAVMFAVVWIIVYVVVFSAADAVSESIGYPKILTVFAGMGMSVILLFFLLKNRLSNLVGLCKGTGKGKSFLFYIPLLVISSVNFWHRTPDFFVFDRNFSVVLAVLCMFFVGFLEEIIFRGLLFTSLCKQSVKAAFVVSSLTFGMGHIINLLTGADAFDTFMQIIYAAAVGFCYTAIFYTGGSILPCVASHIFVNATSEITPTHTDSELVIVTLVQTVLGVAYGCLLLYRNKNSEKAKACDE